jgi:serine/threonine-protein kinase
MELAVREDIDFGIAGTPYTFLRRLGAGGSAEVFEVRDASGRRFALKLLRQTLARSREAQVRFVREARALASVEHPNLAPVVDAGNANGRPYFVMPLLEGETLRERVRRTGPLAATEAVLVTMEVLSALDAAHRAGIVHRDVKPANVFLTAEATIVLDFGVAKILDDGPSEITTGRHVVGTPRYLAPEQILGGRIDARTDVYSVGITLFEALTGLDPFGALSTAQMMRAHVFDEPHRVREFALVSAELDHIVARALERFPAYRWSSAAAFGEALARCRARYLRAADVGRRNEGAARPTYLENSAR